MASRSLGTLTLDLVAKIFGFRQGMDQAARIAEERSRRINRAVGNMSRGFQSLIGFFSAGLFVRAVIRATSEAEFALARLDAVVKSTGNAAGFTTPQLVEMAESLRDVTTFSDEAAIGMEGVLLSFTEVVGPEFQRALELIADVSIALGRDLNSSAIIVGRALNNPVRGMQALSRAGIVFTDSQRKAIKALVDTGKTVEAQNLILDELEERFGGTARAARETFGGAIQGLSNAFQDLLEAKGGLPEVVDEINELTDVLQDPQLKAGLDTLTSGILGFLSGTGRFAGLLAGGVANLAESIAAGIHGANFQDLVRLQDDLVKTQLAYDAAVNAGNQERADYLERELTAIEARIALAEDEIKLSDQRTGAEQAAEAVANRARDAAAEDHAKQVAALEKQVALFGETSRAAEVAYDIQTGALDNLTDAEQDRLVGLAATLDLLTEYKDVAEVYSLDILQLLDKEKKSTEELKQLREELLAIFLETSRVAREELGGLAPTQLEAPPILQGSDEQIEYRVGDALGNLGENIEDVGRRTEDLIPVFEYTMGVIGEESLQAARNIQTAFADFLFDPFEDGLEGMLLGFIDILRRMAAEIAASAILESFGGVEGISGWLGNLFGGIVGGPHAGGVDPDIFRHSFAEGGHVTAGTLAMVGERGPELALFGADANIIPNDELPIGGAVQINNYMDNRGASQDLIRALPRILDERDRRIIGGIRDARSRGKT